MRDVIIQRDNISFDALDKEIRNAIGDAVIGVSASAGQVIVHLKDDIKPPQIEQVKQLVAAHVPPPPAPPPPTLEERVALLEARLNTLEAKQ